MLLHLKVEIYALSLLCSHILDSQSISLLILIGPNNSKQNELLLKDLDMAKFSISEACVRQHRRKLHSKMFGQPNAV